jgi:hypothetical protein
MTELKVTELKATELEALKKRVEELEKSANPPPRSPSTHQPYDPTANFSMPASAMKAMIDAIPSSVMGDLVADARKPNPITGGPNPQPTSQVQRGSGWLDQRPLEPPPGVDLIDRIAEGFAARERRGG